MKLGGNNTISIKMQKFVKVFDICTSTAKIITNKTGHTRTKRAIVYDE